MFSRAEDGALAPLGRSSTGGRGTGLPHLASAGSVVLSDDGRWLLVVKAGSDELSLFAVQPDGLRLADHVPSGGSKPTSVAASGELVYVLNNGTPNISGFNLTDGKLTALMDSTRPLSGAGAGPAQISFTPGGGALIVTERGTNSISSYVLDQRGYAQGPTTIKSFGHSTGQDEKGLRDEAISGDGRYLYAIDADARQLFGWAVGQGGRLGPAGAFNGLPGTVAGLAAS